MYVIYLQMCLKCVRLDMPVLDDYILCVIYLQTCLKRIRLDMPVLDDDYVTQYEEPVAPPDDEIPKNDDEVMY